MASTVYDGYPYVFLIEFFYLFVDWNMMLYQVTHELHHDSNFSLFYSVSNKDMIISFFFIIIIIADIKVNLYKLWQCHFGISFKCNTPIMEMATQ